MRKLFLIISAFLICTTIFAQQKTKKIIQLSLNEVIGISKSENLSLRSKILDYEYQNLETWKSYSNFLPTLSYTAIGVNNLELPVFVFMGQ
ncbi:MAG: hypothetical protein KDC67_12875, partial [Ignavibacteriae bacterium]|nr:hypothetical protein [Ignavibacteriota bacterium]